MNSASTIGNVADARCIAAGGDAPAAECSLWWRHMPALPGRRLGAIGACSAPTPAAAVEVLSVACARLRAEGCTHAIGPMDGSTWYAYRVATWSAGDAPFLLEPDVPLEWARHFEAAGFGVLAHYWSSKCDDLQSYPVDARLDADLRAGGCSTRSLDPARLDDEIELLWRLSGDAFARNFLYAPLTLPAFRSLHAPLLALVRPEFVLLAEQRGEPVGFLFGVPDLVPAAHGAPVDTLIVKTLGVLPALSGRGIGRWLVDRAIVQARAAGLTKAIFALMHEANASRRIGRGAMRDFRRYTLFEKAL